MRPILFILDPDINLFSITSVDSCCGLIDGVGLVPIDGLLNLPASFFLIKSPLFSAAFLPSLSPVWEIPDSSAFFSKWFDKR